MLLFVKETRRRQTLTSQVDMATSTTPAADTASVLQHFALTLTMTPSSPEVTSSPGGGGSRDAAFYFQWIVVVVGLVGAAANALVLYAMAASQQHKKQLLIFNQNALDLASCVFLVLTYSVKLCNVHLSGTTGYWLCITT